MVDIQIFQEMRRVGLLGRRVGIFVNLTMDWKEEDAESLEHIIGLHVFTFSIFKLLLRLLSLHIGLSEDCEVEGRYEVLQFDQICFFSHYRLVSEALRKDSFTRLAAM